MAEVEDRILAAARFHEERARERHDEARRLLETLQERAEYWQRREEKLVSLANVAKAAAFDADSRRRIAEDRLDEVEQLLARRTFPDPCEHDAALRRQLAESLGLTELDRLAAYARGYIRGWFDKNDGHHYDPIDRSRDELPPDVSAALLAAWERALA